MKSFQRPVGYSCSMASLSNAAESTLSAFPFSVSLGGLISRALWDILSEFVDPASLLLCVKLFMFAVSSIVRKKLGNDINARDKA